MEIELVTISWETKSVTESVSLSMEMKMVAELVTLVKGRGSMVDSVNPSSETSLETDLVKSTKLQ